ncbi:MAG: hypothetical protein WBN18_10980 [Flavobacteriaceae bacterium]
MKINLAWVLSIGISLCQGETMFSQAVESGVKSNEVPTDGQEQGPMIFKFEPDYLLSVEDRKQQILKYRAIIDTMTISGRKRRSLLKDLYKNGISERLSKMLLADTKFEDIE